MSEIQVASENLTTYEKKVVCSEIPAFVALLQDDSLDLLEKANRVMSDEYTSFAMRAWALMVHEYLTFEETPEDKDRAIKAMRILGKLEKINPNRVLAFKIQKNPMNALALIEQSEENRARIQARIEYETLLIDKATSGAQRASQIAFDRGLKYGELRDSPSQSTGKAIEKLTAGVYRITLGKSIYRYVHDSATNWVLYAVSGTQVAFVADYKSIKEHLSGKDDPRSNSATRARKIAKCAKVGYRGFSGQEAIASAFMAKFASMSAGNPTTVNFTLVDSEPLVWLDSVKRSGNKGKKHTLLTGNLPTEITKTE